MGRPRKSIIKWIGRLIFGVDIDWGSTLFGMPEDRGMRAADRFGAKMEKEQAARDAAKAAAEPAPVAAPVAAAPEPERPVEQSPDDAPASEPSSEPSLL